MAPLKQKQNNSLNPGPVMGRGGVTPVNRASNPHQINPQNPGIYSRQPFGSNAPFGPAGAAQGGAVPPSRPLVNQQNLGQELQQNSNVKGAYGNWGNSSNTNNPQSAASKPTVNPNPRPGIPGLSPRSLGNNTSGQNPNQKYSATKANAYQSSFVPQSNQAFQNSHLKSSNLNRFNTQPNTSQPTAQPIQASPYVNPFVPNQNVAVAPPKVVAKPPKKSKNGIFNFLFGSSNNSNPTRRRKLDPNSREYLETLTPTQLRQEVIKTEVDIQKTLIQTEKAYREGVSTIRDLIAPSSVDISVSQISIGTKLIRSFFILTYPRVINSGWLEGVVNIDIPMDISVFIYPQDNDDILRELKGKVGKIQAALNLNYERGSARDPALETAYRDVESLRDAIQQGVERFFRVGVYFTIYADDPKEMEKLSQTVESILSQQSIVMKRSALQMGEGFTSTLPINKDGLYIFNNMNTSPLSACFPFVSSDLSANTGILYGMNRQNSSLILFDRFELENANTLVFATSGAGKSYFVKLEILRSLMIGTSVIIIDPENEYKFLSDAVGGAYLNVSLNSNNRINPFDLPKQLPGESNADILRSAIIDLMGLMNLMLGKLTPTEEGIMERAINECYAKRDINPNSDFNNITPPTMTDLVEILNGIVGGESLSQRLYKYTEGTFSGIFNRPTNINMNNQLVVFNLRDLQEALRPIAMYILLKYVWNEIRSELKQRILAVDEAWILMQNEDSARFLFGLVKRARKYYLGVTTITQDVQDFLNSPFGRPIVTNASMKLLLKQSTAAIDIIGETFALTEGEKQLLLSSGVGQGIYFAGPRHVAIEILATPNEHRIVTSNPKEILAMREAENGKI